MSSKVHLDNRADSVRPFAWRTVAITGETVDRRKAADHPQPPEAQAAETQGLVEKRAREAHDAGFREGEAAGRAQAQAELRSSIERLAASIAEIDAYRGQVLRHTEADAVLLAIAIARRVLRRELTVDPAAIQGLVRAALERLQSQEGCRIRMHPDYVPALRASIEELGMGAKVEVIPDPAQESGAAVFEMPRGNLDASIDSQLREIERGLADRFEKPR